MATMLGLPAVAGLTPEWTDPLHFYAPEWRNHMSEALTACARQAIAFDEEAQIVTRQGKRLWVRASGEALRDASGTVVRLQGIFQDLTDKKQAENESLGVTMRLSTTLASIKEAFVTLDRMSWVPGPGRVQAQRHDARRRPHGGERA